MQRSWAVLVMMAGAALLAACATPGPGADQARRAQEPRDVPECKLAGSVQDPHQVAALGSHGAVTVSAADDSSERFADRCP